ncbi:MAG: sodium/proline symporter [Calditrichia bacterium]
MEETLATKLPVSGYAVAAFVGYLLIVMVIGILASRFSSAGIREYFLGGRKMNRFVVALSAVVSGRSAWLLLGVTGMAYKMGASAVWAVVGYIVVEMFLFRFYAARLRRFSEQYDCITLPDFFATRFADRSGWLRIILVVIILIFMISYVSAQFLGGGKAFAASFQLSQAAGIFLTAGIVLFYTMLGGFLAVSLTDMLQAFFMLLALLILPVVAIMDRGGLLTVLHQLRALDPALIDPLALSAGVFIGFLGIGLGSPGNPHIIVRYMSIKDPEQLRVSTVVGTVWNVLMAWGALFIGLVGRLYFPETTMLPHADTENLYPLLAQQHLHPVLFGMVIASIFAAIMSTADSQLLVAVSSVVRDFYEKVWRKKQVLDHRRLVLYSRIMVVFLVGLALTMGLLASEQVFWLVLIAWAGLGAAIGPTSILALYWRRTTYRGVIAGFLTGTVVTIIWYYTPALKAQIYELIPAFGLALLATILVSLLSSPPPGVREMFECMTSRQRNSSLK